MPLRPGYKETEVGLLPESWTVKPLSSITEKIMVGIASAATHAYRSTGVPMFRNQNIRRGWLDDQDLLYIAPEYEVVFRNKRLRAGDLVTMRTGYPGLTAIVPPQYDSAQSFTTLISRPRQQEAESAYLCHFMNSEIGQSFFAQSQIGGAQKNVNASTLRGMPVVLPSIPEQRAIATVLSDVDALLDGLTGLIAKKRNLKQAAMQQLLTGRARLPGFRGVWASVRLATIGDAYAGLTGKSSADFGAGGGRYIAFVDVIRRVAIRSGSTFERVRVGSGEAQNAVKRGDLLLNGSSETPEEVAMCALCDVDERDLFLNSFCFGFRLRPSAEADALFLAYLLRSDAGRTVTRSLAQGSTRYNIAKSAFLDACLLLPSRIEQAAIATVLSDMDAELTALDARRAKTQALKQAMMQALLTGRIRLVSPEPAHA